MRRVFLMMGAVYGLLFPAWADAWPFTTVTVQVITKDGKPAAGENVLLVGVSRDSPMAVEQAAKATGWNFVTDRDGKLVLKLGRFAAAEHHEKEKAWLPGWGEYFLVVPPSEKHAGAVSPCMVNRQADTPATGTERWGKPVLVTQEPLEVILILQEAIMVTGKVQDLTGAPVADLAFSLVHDLSTNSQSAALGEIFRQDARSDRHGFFEFRKVYPAPFHLSLETVPPYWVQTRLGGQWQDGIVDEFEAGVKNREVLIGLVVSSRKIHRYYGQVKDERGKSVHNAKVILGVSEHRRPQTYRDENNYVEVMTGSDGRYEISVETPWVRGFSVEAPGYEKRDYWPTDGRMQKPGLYNFSLKLLK